MSEFMPYRPEWAPALLAVWQAAWGDRFPISRTLWDANTAADPSFSPTDLLVAHREGRLIGFLLTKRFREAFPTCERYADVGYLALMAILPEFQRQGVGLALLEAGEAHLRAQGARRAILGGSFHHFLPGIPQGATAARAFFAAHGYVFGQDVWDVRRDLKDGFVMPDVGPNLAGDFLIRPFRHGEEPALERFLLQTFPGRWAHDAAQHLRQGESIAAIMGLFQEDRPQGFALLHPPGSIGAWRWVGFDPQIAALGPIGVSPDVQGRGLGMALLVRGIERLQALGAVDMVIDWTDLLDFYGKCGFAPWQRYTLAQKVLE